MHDVCVAAGVPVWCGGMLETGLGRAANVALAALPGFTLPGDLSASDRYFARDITAPFVLEDGWPGRADRARASASKWTTTSSREVTTTVERLPSGKH